MPLIVVRNYSIFSILYVLFASVEEFSNLKGYAMGGNFLAISKLLANIAI